MSYLAGATRARHAFVETAQAELAAILAMPETVELLGSTEHAMLLQRNEQIFVPNMRDDTVRVPQEYQQTEWVPVTPVNPDKALTCWSSALTQTRRQQEFTNQGVLQITNDAAEARRHRKEIAYRFRYASPAVIQTMGNQGQTISLSKKVTIGNTVDGQSHTHNVLGRPTITINQAINRQVAIILAHELTHAHDNLENPLKTYASRSLGTASNELYAYRNSCILAKFLLDQDLVTDPEQRFHLEADVGIEAARAKHADPENPYTPNEPMLAAIRKIQPFPWATVDLTSTN